PRERFSGEWRELRFASSPAYPEPELAAVLVEPEAPVLIALHGRGEAGRGLEAGARGWRDDYDLDRARDRVLHPPLTEADFHGFVAPERLADLNASLARDPYRGLTVACPYAPALFDRSVEGAAPYGRFLTDVLLPEVRNVARSPREPAQTAIDGVSMGGRLALLIGLSRPDTFGVVGALQPAIGVQEADQLADLAARAATQRPQALRLVSSDDDPFREAVIALGEALAERHLPHEVILTPGPHDYIWNKGPGSYELLLWHERRTRGLKSPGAG
ncbi:MAG: esterase, partial [Myxococcales bacterium]|nr:esterase [Myxococcales bacterium]